ncbi:MULTISPECIES: hypothetical protein [Kordiimonas]|jgi:hypothetical protein|uniref:hypothetical protein n=1 Tax=Kordiimonas TaxID=288021 RepID=UPI00257D5A52|nr:hypothetical protein [Kordiimonas sp. UBA4487]
MEDEYTVVYEAWVAARKAYRLVERGLGKNPSDDERRELEIQLLELGREKERLKNKLAALEAEFDAAQPPTEEQIEAVKGLMAKVEAHTNATITASAALGLAASALDFTSKV